MNLRNVLLAATAAVPLAGCMEPLPPCPDEACVAQRMMILGVMSRMVQQNEANQQAVQSSLNDVVVAPEPYVSTEPTWDTPAMPPMTAPQVQLGPPPRALPPVPSLGTIGPYGQPADLGGPVTITNKATGESTPAWRGPIDLGGHATVIGPHDEEIHVQSDPTGPFMMQDYP